MNEFKYFKAIFLQMNDENKLFYILNLLVRQRNMFLDFCDKVSFKQQEKCKGVFEELFQCIKENRKFDMFDVIEEINPENYRWSNEVDEMTGYVITVIDNIRTFANQINDRTEIDSYFLKCNYDLIEAYIFDIKEIDFNDKEAIFNDIDMKREIEREKKDINEFKNSKFKVTTILACTDILLEIKY